MNLIDPGQVTELALRYGEPLRWQRSLDVSPEMLDTRLKAIGKKQGETVLAIPRPGGRVLLHTKSFYPPEAYRLLSGGIEIDEPVEAAVKREAYEETGFDIQPARFLGIVEYEFKSQGAPVEWVSYVFLTEETREAPRVTDPHERITGFREAVWSELANVAWVLEQLPDAWRDWGRFRAIPHRLVIQAMDSGLFLP